MKKWLFLTTILFFLIQINSTYATESLNTKSIDNLYNSVINSNLSYNEKIKKMSSLWYQLSIVLENPNLSIYNKKFINDYFKKTNEKIFTLKYENDRKQEQQKLIESKKVSDLRNSIRIAPTSNYIYNLVSSDRRLITTNSDFEFVDWVSIKKVDFDKAYIVKPEQIEQFKEKKWLIVNKSWEDIFYLVENYTIEEKIPYSKLWTYTKWFITSKTPYLLENWVYYTYIYENFRFFQDTYWLYIKSLWNFWDISNYILYKKDDWRYVFVIDYKKAKLISDNIIYWIPWKYNFLKEVLNDIAPPWTTLTDTIYDQDDNYKKLKNNTQNLVRWLKSDEKIKKIYSYILENVNYSQKIDFSDKKIFSWILTYKNKDWVCTWYTKLFLFMLTFAWIDDAEVIRWNVIDAPDFPDVWHAWVKKWDYYYDPTFDDPVWTTKTRNFDEYRYYKLPKDLFYTNRYDYADTPEAIKTTSMDYRKSVVKKNLSTLTQKYKDSNYVLLKPYQFRQKYWFTPDEKITIEKAKKIKPFYKVVSNYLQKDWESKFITNIYFYTLSDNDFEAFLEQFNYNLDDFTFLERKLESWNTEYRAWKDIKF
jgi:hypothetical protein